MNQTFKAFQLRDFLLDALEKMRISEPTPIQTKAIPAILQGKDVIGQSLTGTGKTLAYLLPVLQQMDVSRQEVQAVILVPTKELARQIADTALALSEGTGLDVLMLLSGVDMTRQTQQLKRNPQLIIGTPGRIFDLIKEGSLASYTAKWLVLDEADTMLEMGFREEMENIIQKMKKNMQMLLFAATFPPRVAGMTKAFMKKPLHIQINPAEKTVSAIENVFVKAKNGAKEKLLAELIRLYNPYLGIVFVRKKEQVNDLVDYLHQSGIETEGLHGDLQRGHRKLAMQRIRNAKSQILVATDIASRGLDVEGITHVFNFDLPISVDQYIHRIGRTGRAGETGTAVNLIFAFEEDKLRLIETKLGQGFKEIVLRGDQLEEKPAGRKKVQGEIVKTVPEKKGTPKKYTGPNSKKKAIKEKQTQLKKKEKELKKEFFKNAAKENKSKSR